MGTQDVIATFVSFVANKWDKYEDVSVIFLDITNAFNSINHDVLLYKVYFNGSRGVVHQWCASYLKNYMQYVNADGIKSILRLF